MGIFSWGWGTVPVLTWAAVGGILGMRHRSQLCPGATQSSQHILLPSRGTKSVCPQRQELCHTPQCALPRAGRLWKQGRVAGLGRKGVRQLWGRILRKWEQAGRADFAHPGKQTA